jgi:carboxymethylenebutenolidase
MDDPPVAAWPHYSLLGAGSHHHGAEDTGIKVEQVKDMEAKLKAAGKTAEFRIYPGAPHGFHADYRPNYRKEAADDVWKRMTDWFKKYKVLS